jgi:CRISPR-associated endonuclease/helicase Cas3
VAFGKNGWKISPCSRNITVKDLLLFWAKLGSATWPEKYHPVACHLIDVAAVAQNLWDAVFRSQFRMWLAGRLGLEEKDCVRWLAFWSGAHDIGKVAPCFQDRNDARTADLKAKLRAGGLSFHGGVWPHGTISAAVLADLLTRPAGWPALPESFASRVAIAVGGHHGLFPADWSEVSKLLKCATWDQPWHEARREILHRLAGLIGVDGRVPHEPDTADQSIFMVVAGVTSVADWIGSNQEFFQPIGNPEVAAGRFDLEDYYRWAMGQARRALQQLGWLDREPPTGPRSFQDVFADILSGEPRPLQRRVEEIAAKLTEPALLVIESPMGEGKTEAAWYVADVWDARGGQGSYVALPTMATSNQMFERVARFLGRNPGKSNLLLSHGKAQLNERFNERLRLAEIYDEEKRPSEVVAEGWFAANKKHGLLAPYGVGTIDQALLAVLQTKHVFVRLFGLAGKCVILDEVHAYDAYMSTLLERLLQWLAALGCPVVLLSATLPKEKRQKLVQAYALGQENLVYEDRPYPRMTVLRPGISCSIQVEHVEPATRSRTVRLTWKRPEKLADELKVALADGGCAAVIRNTVGLAQRTYLELKKALADTDIEVEWLFHARFPFGRRQQIEDRVLRRYGKGPDGRSENPERSKKAVLVATQVVEQSLDLDFDLLVTDVAPVDLILQRAGRLWRHGDRLRPTGIPEANLWLLEAELSAAGVPQFGGSSFVYDAHILLRSYLVLKGAESAKRLSLQFPEEIDDLIQTVYQEGNPPVGLSLPLREFWDATVRKYRDSIESESDQAESRQIKKPIFRGDFTRMVTEPREEDSPELHPAHQALTRLTRPTVALVCLIDEGDGQHRLPHNGQVVSPRSIRKMSEGGTDDVRNILLGEVSSAHPGLVRELASRPLVPSAWKKVGILARHHLVTFQNGSARIGEHKLRLDNDIGLEVTALNAPGGEDE